MGRQELEQTARELIAEGKGILSHDRLINLIRNKRLFSGAESQPSVFLEDLLRPLVHGIAQPASLTPRPFMPYVHAQEIWNSPCDSHAARATLTWSKRHENS